MNQSPAIMYGVFHGYNQEKSSKAKKVKKPPIGLIPKHLHDEERRMEIVEAIQRCFENDPMHQINVEWIEEYNELCKKINGE